MVSVFQRILIQQLWEKFLLAGEKKVIDSLNNKITYPELEIKVKEITDMLGKEIMRMVLEAQDEYLVNNRKERPGWVIERRDEEKRVVTVFGEMCYRRTYFYNKENKLSLLTFFDRTLLKLRVQAGRSSRPPGNASSHELVLQNILTIRSSIKFFLCA